MKPDLLLENQINAAAQNAFFQFSLAHKMALFLDTPNLATWIHGIATSRLIYCNLAYIRLPSKSIQKLQLVQNARV